MARELSEARRENEINPLGIQGMEEMLPVWHEMDGTCGIMPGVPIPLARGTQLAVHRWTGARRARRRNADLVYGLQLAVTNMKPHDVRLMHREQPGW